MIRVQAGEFYLKDSIVLDELGTIEQVKKNILSPLSFLKYSQYELSQVEYEKISHGMPIKYNSKREGSIPNGQIIILIYLNQIAAVGELEEDTIKIKKVFTF